MATSKTLGPLHFEDLEPKRFEDLVRQLAYEFRTWRKLEATGRSGSDDGFDARGLEIVSDIPESNGIEDRSDDEVDTISADRLWLIQCKREQRIGPKKFVEYLDDIHLQPGEGLHGIVFAAACDFSKKAHDRFVEKCRSLGVQECYLWGKAAIEDLLFQPKNDHLLFAYFGFSLLIRQRTIQATLRRDIATKKRLKTVMERNANRVVIVRNASGDMYPTNPPPKTKFAADHWRLCSFEELSHMGLVVEYAAYLAFFDGQVWDAADGIGLERSHVYLGHTWQGRDQNDPYEAASSLWDTFDQNRAWLHVLAVIPYNRILAIDDVGDEYFDLPQLYCQYDGRWPFGPNYASVKRVGGFGNADTKWVEPQDPARVERFPAEFRRQEVLAKANHDSEVNSKGGQDPAPPTGEQK